jgi:hypothetical protein
MTVLPVPLASLGVGRGPRALARAKTIRPPISKEDQESGKSVAGEAAAAKMRA